MGARPVGERGSAVVEFVFLTVLLTIPMIYLVLTLARVQAGTYAVSAAAREAGRAYVTAEGARGAEVRARAAAWFAFEDQDAPVIEAQQMRLEAAGGAISPVMLAIDAGPVRYKRILQRRLEEEKQ